MVITTIIFYILALTVITVIAFFSFRNYRASAMILKTIDTYMSKQFIQEQELSREQEAAIKKQQELMQGIINEYLG